MDEDDHKTVKSQLGCRTRTTAASYGVHYGNLATCGRQLGWDEKTKGHASVINDNTGHMVP
jgi:hypothetical protein